ncbi:hypothetical protein Tco_1485770 [Tanacetum coccineum]
MQVATTQTKAITGLAIQRRVARHREISFGKLCRPIIVLLDLTCRFVGRSLRDTWVDLKECEIAKEGLNT